LRGWGLCLAGDILKEILRGLRGLEGLEGLGGLAGLIELRGGEGMAEGGMGGHFIIRRGPMAGGGDGR
jgi:hypothetical protein